MPEPIELKVGSSLSLAGVQLGIAGLALLSILIVDTQFPWKVIALACWLVLATAGTRFILSRDTRATMRLHSDGLVSLDLHKREVQALLPHTAWISRWLIVLTLSDMISGMKYRCVVCASNNSTNNYRRLLVRLRVCQAQKQEGYSA